MRDFSFQHFVRQVMSHVTFYRLRWEFLPFPFIITFFNIPISKNTLKPTVNRHWPIKMSIQSYLTWDLRALFVSNFNVKLYSLNVCAMCNAQCTKSSIFLMKYLLLLVFSPAFGICTMLIIIPHSLLHFTIYLYLYLFNFFLSRLLWKWKPFKVRTLIRP